MRCLPRCRPTKPEQTGVQVFGVPGKESETAFSQNELVPGNLMAGSICRCGDTVPAAQHGRGQARERDGCGEGSVMRHSVSGPYPMNCPHLPRVCLQSTGGEVSMLILGSPVLLPTQS